MTRDTDIHRAPSLATPGPAPARGGRRRRPGPTPGYGFGRGMATALGLVLGLALAAPALAQQVPGPKDLQALNYYLDRGDNAAAKAELQRLRGAFPDWKVPTDLSTLKQSAPTTEIDRIYAQIAQKDLTGAHKTLSDTMKRYPNWTPPKEMTQLLSVADAQAAFDAAVDAGQSQAAIRIARDNQSLLQCDRVNNAWELADMYHSQKDDDAAVQTYRAVIRACTDFDLIKASLQKADPVASDSQLNDLFTLAKGRFAAQTPALNQLQAQLIAGRGGDARAVPPTETKTAKIALPGPTPEKTAPPKRRPVAAEAPRRAAPSVATLVAPVPGRAASPPASGRGLPAHGDGRVARTHAAAARGDWVSCIGYSNAPRSLDLLYERAWCSYNLDRPLEALAAFRMVDRGDYDATVDRDARFGMTLSYLKLNMTEDAAVVAAQTDLTLKQRTEVETTILDQRGTRAYNEREYTKAIAYFNALEKLGGGLRRDLAILRAYAYLNSGNKHKAYTEFSRLNDELVTPETRAGIRASSGE